MQIRTYGKKSGSKMKNSTFTILLCKIKSFWEKSIWDEWVSTWSLINSKILADLCLVTFRNCWFYNLVVFINCQFYNLLILINSILIKQWYDSTRLNFVSWNKVGNFRGFLVFDFGPYAEIENSENSKNFSRLLNLSEFLLFEKIRNFRGFQVLNFDPYAEIENSEKSKISSRLVIVLLEDVGNFRDFWVFDFGSYTEIKNSENSEIFFKTSKLEWISFIWEIWEFLRFLSFGFGPLSWNQNLEKFGNFSGRVIVHWRKFQTSDVFEFLILLLMLKLKTRKIRNFFKTCKVKWICFVWRKL